MSQAEARRSHHAGPGYNPKLEGYEVNIGEQQLRGAPKYGKHESWDWSDRARGQQVYDYYGVGPYWGS